MPKTLEVFAQSSEPEAYVKNAQQLRILFLLYLIPLTTSQEFSNFLKICDNCSRLFDGEYVIFICMSMKLNKVVNVLRSNCSKWVM